MQTRHRSARLLAVFILSLCAWFFAPTAKAQEAPPPAGHQQQQQQQQQQQPQQEQPTARREDTEPETLAQAKAMLKEARGERDKAESDRAAAEAAHGNTKELLKSTLAIAETAKKDLAAMTGERDKAVQERDAEKADHAQTKESLTLAEAALGVHGVAPKKAVKQEPEPSGDMLTYAQWEAKRNAAKPGPERAKVLEDFEAAVQAGRIATA